jgi:predicted nucleic-acid-binding Zn-ribbon protein
MDQPTTCKECGSQNLETGWVISTGALSFKTGPRLFDPTRPMIAIACLDCGHVA